MANLSDKLAAGGAPVVLTATNANIDLTGNTNLKIWVMCDTSSSALSVTLPAGLSGQSVRVIDAGENAGTNIITVIGTIDGATNATIEANSGSLAVAFGTAWESAGGFDQFFTRNASTGEITSRAPDTLIANTLRTGVFNPLDQSVADVEFTAIGANVDQTVADEFGNALVASSTEFNDGAPNTDATTPYTVNASPSTLGALYEGWKAFDDDDGTFCIINGAGNKRLDIDTGSLQTFVAFSFRTGTGANDTPVDYKIYASTDTVVWDEVYDRVGDTIGINSNSPVIDFTLTGSYRHLRFESSKTGSGSNTSLSLSRLSYFTGGEATTLNTFDTNLASGTSGTFAPSSFLAYDESTALINGTGKINVAYSVDGGAFSSLVDQESFKALANIFYTTQFDIRCQLVGSQRFSRFTLSAPSVSTRITSDGNMQVLESNTVVSSIGSKGVAPVSLTTAERDALTDVTTGAMIYNETTKTIDLKDSDSQCNLVKSQPFGVTGADAITNIVSLTQSEYDAITPHATTVYVIVG